MTDMTRLVARAVLAPVLMVSAAWLVRGANEPGDGFSAGVTAGAALLIQYIVFGHRDVGEHTRLAPAGPLLGFAGLAVMVAVTMAGPLLGDALLTQYPGPGDHVIEIGRLSLHSAVLYDAGIALLVFGLLAAILEMYGEVAEETPP